ncbi:hypothetical protein OEA41_002803 [Lepraria neglecta]|uniref:Apple domain-containing protein n=1 Tax=Lepraria neglecta TaxID=209136 RepID=A0AAD9Z4K2_9LECA|nr:hypothetical protein OEA41_002803 [Lepraria neglecta]
MSYRVSPSAIELDLRSNLRGLEVDLRNNGLHTNYDADAPPESYNNNSLPEAYKETHENTNDEVSRKREANTAPLVWRQKRNLIWMSGMLALGWTVAVVAATLAGTLALKRQHDLHQGPSPTCNIDPNNTCSPSQNSSIFQNSVPSNSTSTTNSTCVAATDCSALSSLYTAFNDVQFDLLCKTDYPSYDLMAVYVFQFEDCINACVSYNKGTGHPNSTCLSVSYDTAIPRGDTNVQNGNCFLKSITGIPATAKDTSSSATLLTN